MLHVLESVEKELPVLLQDEDEWDSLFIDYHPPVVERLYRAWGEYRISLHRIHPCQPGEALFHPHPWPSAMRLLSGRYEMAVGFGSGEQVPPVATLLIAAQDSRYEMTHPDSWHYVRPLDAPVMTLMVTGRPWARPAPSAGRKLDPLGDRQRDEILRFFRERYPLR